MKSAEMMIWLPILDIRLDSLHSSDEPCVLLSCENSCLHMYAVAS